MPHTAPKSSSGLDSESETVPLDPVLEPHKVCATISSVQSIFGTQWFPLGNSVDAQAGALYNQRVGSRRNQLFLVHVGTQL